MTVRLIVIRTGPASFRVRSSASPQACYLTNPHLSTVRTLADNLGGVVTEWEPLGRLLAFFAASNEDQLKAAEALGIAYREE